MYDEYGCAQLGIFESVKFIDDIKRDLANTKELRDQWRKVADTFVNHKWIDRYIYDEKQKLQLEKHYAVLTGENTTYSAYKRSFQFISKFMGLPHDKIIIENMTFSRDKVDKEQYKISLKYSRGCVKVTIPEGVRLIHVSPVDGIDALIPTFRSKVKGKYMYPTRRVFFTVAKDIRLNQAGLEGQKKINRYTPKQEIRTAYIDPTYSSFSSGAVYIETDSPIPVETIEKKLFGLFSLGKKKEDKK